jgi:hypothetical protein
LVLKREKGFQCKEVGELVFLLQYNKKPSIAVFAKDIGHLFYPEMEYNYNYLKKLNYSGNLCT